MFEKSDIINVMEETAGNKGYGKRPMWQWVVIYLIIGLVVYGLIYYFVIAKKGGSSMYGGQPYQAQQSVSPTAVQSSTAPASTNNVYMTKTDSAKGNYLTDSKGMTLYIFDKDTAGVSNCENGCLKTWPPYIPSPDQTTLPENISIIKRSDGSSQFAWKKMPLYYYASDQKAGDITGDGVGGVWHLITP